MADPQMVQYKWVEILDVTPVGRAGQSLNTNFTAIADNVGPQTQEIRNPTAADDVSADLYVWSHWLNTITGEAFICLDNTLNAAIWQSLADTKAAGATGNIQINDDGSIGADSNLTWDGTKLVTPSVATSNIETTDADLTFTDATAGPKTLSELATDTITNPAGSDNQIQFNNAGVFGADALLTWDGVQLSTPAVVTSSVATSVGDLTFQDSNIGPVTLTDLASSVVTPPAGLTTQIQFNEAGVFGASASLTWDGTQLGVSSVGTTAVNLVFEDATVGVKTLTELSTDTIVDPAGLNGEIQFNNAGVFGADVGLTWDGTQLGVASIGTTQDNLLFTDATAGSKTLSELAVDTVTSPAGLNTEIQFNDNGVFGSNVQLTWDGIQLATPGLWTNYVIRPIGDLTFEDSTTGSKTLAELATDTITSPSGATTQLQFNDNGSFGGIAELTFDGTSISTTTDFQFYEGDSGVILTAYNSDRANTNTLYIGHDSGGNSRVAFKSGTGGTGVYLTTNEESVSYIDSSPFSVGTDVSYAKLTVVGNGIILVDDTFTGLVITDNITPNTDKVGVYRAEEYDNLATPRGFVALAHTAGIDYNSVSIGGGLGGSNAATQINLYTAPTVSTLSGVRALSVLSDTTIEVPNNNQKVTFGETSYIMSTGPDLVLYDSTAGQKTLTELVANAATPPAGATTQIQFNSAGAFGADASLTWDGLQLVTPKISTPNIETTSANLVLSDATAGSKTLSELADGGGGVPGGLNTQLQFNDNGVFGGIQAVTWDGVAIGVTVPLTFSAGSYIQWLNDDLLFTDENTGQKSLTELAAGAVTPPAGANTQIQFNDNGSFGAAANFTYGGTWISMPAIQAPSIATSNLDLTFTDVNTGTKTLTELATDTDTIVNPAGLNSQIQFNNAGVFGASGDLTWDGASLTVTGRSSFTEGVGVVSDATGITLGFSQAGAILHNGVALVFQDENGGPYTLADLAAGVGGAVPGGADTQIQYNDGGSLGGISTVVWDDTSFNLAADDLKLGFGAAGIADSYIQFDGTDLVFYDSAIGVEKTLADLAASGGGGGAPGGLDGQFQFNDSDTFGGTAALAWDGFDVRVGADLFTDRWASLATNTIFGVGNVGGGLLTGASNTILGSDSFTAATSARENVAIGLRALTSVTTGNNNVAIGLEALGNSLGSNNVAIGSQAIYGAIGSSAFSNVALGYRTLRDVTTGAYNAAFGSEALSSATTANQNVAIGSDSLKALSTGTYNVAIGAQTLIAADGIFSCVAIGFGARANATEGNNVVAIGDYAARNIEGPENVAIGVKAMNGTSQSSGAGNVAVGNNTLSVLTAGTQNVVVGYYTAGKLTSGNFNIAIGGKALNAVTTSSENVGIGQNALSLVVTGTDNVAVGYDAGRNYVGSSCTFIGNSAGKAATTGVNQIAIGYNSVAAGDNTAVIGNSTTTNTYLKGIAHADAFQFTASKARAITLDPRLIPGSASAATLTEYISGTLAYEHSATVNQGAWFTVQLLHENYDFSQGLTVRVVWNCEYGDELNAEFGVTSTILIAGSNVSAPVTVLSGAIVTPEETLLSTDLTIDLSSIPTLTDAQVSFTIFRNRTGPNDSLGEPILVFGYSGILYAKGAA